MKQRHSTPIPLAAPEARLVPCTQCARCCRYVAVGINAPTRERYATDILWYLYHDAVSVHCDMEGEWSVAFETRCRHLQEDLRCAIYARRPHICRGFDERSCEVNSPGGRTFNAPDEFIEYLKRERPRLHATLARRFLPALAARPA